MKLDINVVVDENKTECCL